MTEAEHDPVCGMEAHDKRWTTVYQGREYAFCSGGCRVLFQRDPGARLSGKGEKTRYDLVIIGIETVKQGHPPFSPNEHQYPQRILIIRSDGASFRGCVVVKTG